MYSFVLGFTAFLAISPSAITIILLGLLFSLKAISLASNICGGTLFLNTDSKLPSSNAAATWCPLLNWFWSGSNLKKDKLTLVGALDILVYWDDFKSPILVIPALLIVSMVLVNSPLTALRLFTIGWLFAGVNSGKKYQGKSSVLGWFPTIPVTIGIGADCKSWIRLAFILTPYVNNWSSKFKSWGTAIVTSEVLRLSILAKTGSIIQTTFPPYIMYWSIINLSFSVNFCVGFAIIIASYFGRTTNSWVESFMVLSVRL